MCDELEKGSGGTSPSLNNARWWPLGGCPGCFLRLVPGEGSVRVQGKEKKSCEYCKHITRFHILRNTKMNIVCGYNQEFRPKAMLKSWFLGRRSPGFSSSCPFWRSASCCWQSSAGFHTLWAQQRRRWSTRTQRGPWLSHRRLLEEISWQ